MPDEQLDVRDLRPGFYYIHNEVYTEYSLSLVALGIYNDIACRANNGTQRAYFALNAFCKRFRVGKSTVIAAFKELINAGLIAVTGSNGRGCKTVVLLNVKETGSRQDRSNQPVPQGTSEALTGSVENRGGSMGDPNKTNKQDDEEDNKTHMCGPVIRPALEYYTAKTGQFYSAGNIMVNIKKIQAETGLGDEEIAAGIKAYADAKFSDNKPKNLGHMLQYPNRWRTWMKKQVAGDDLESQWEKMQGGS